MKSLLLFIIVAFIFVSCNQNPSVAEPETPGNETPAVNENVVAEVTVPEWGNTHCPIMENPITEDGGSTVYQGKTVRFCCPKCIKKFNADPEKYMATLVQYTPEKK